MGKEVIFGVLSRRRNKWRADGRVLQGAGNGREGERKLFPHKKPPFVCRGVFVLEKNLCRGEGGSHAEKSEV
jgi:hypothetical protein